MPATPRPRRSSSRRSRCSDGPRRARLAQTGTGKTAGFTLPMIEILASGRAKARMPRSLILEPTRELAAQVAENFETYGKHQQADQGAADRRRQLWTTRMRLLDRGVDVLIATPGRLLDHVRARQASCSTTSRSW